MPHKWLQAFVVATGCVILGGAASIEMTEFDVGLTDPTLSLGLNGVNDWSTELPFLDLMKMSRPLFGYSNSSWEALDHAGLEASGVLDANGWPTAIPDGMTGIRTGWGFANDTPGLEGPFVLIWEGEGTISLGSATVTSSSDHRIVFTNPDSGTFWLNIAATDPNDNGNYIRNIRIVPEKYEALADLGEVFNPDFLAVVEDARELRFMDWMATNGSVQSEWADRPQVNDVTWATYGTAMNGVPLEIMVQLANQTGTDPWFNIPHLATDDYVEQFATYVHDHLDPALVAHVEYSNEMWNYSFQQTKWADAQAKALWGMDPIGGIPPTSLDYQVMRGTQVAMIWDEVFGTSAEARVENVLGLQNGNAWWLQNRMLNGYVWQTMDPANFVSPASAFDALAVTTYFGGSTVVDSSLRGELLSYLASHTAEQTYDWLAGKLIDPAYSSSIPQIARLWASVKTVADAYGLDLLAYEGGQHVHQSFSVGGLTPEQLNVLTAFMPGFVRSQQMASLYDALWDAWSKVSDGPFMQFGDVAASSKFGTWGMLQYLGDTTPRASFLDTQNATEPSWFGDGGGTRYQQGVIKIAGDGGETLTGTQKADFLVGGAGNDTFLPGIGKDAINGDAGVDTIILSGKPQDYTLLAEGKGYRLTGLNTSTFVINVEQFKFDSGQTYTVGDK